MNEILTEILGLKDTNEYAEAVELLTRQLGSEFKHSFNDDAAVREVDGKQVTAGSIILLTRIQLDKHPFETRGWTVKQQG